MKYTEEMILQSDSGYCMPFEEQQGKDVELSLGYGEQTDPATGEKFFHHGIDFNVRCFLPSPAALCRAWATIPDTASARPSATGSMR